MTSITPRTTKAQLIELLNKQAEQLQAAERQARLEAERTRTALVCVLTVIALWLAF